MYLNSLVLKYKINFIPRTVTYTQNEHLMRVVRALGGLLKVSSYKLKVYFRIIFVVFYTIVTR